MANAKLGSKAVGSIVKLKVNGAAKEFIVVHQGKPGSMYDESCNGTWLLMKDIYENRQWNSSDSNVYETSTVNTYLNGPFLGLFGTDIQGIIKQVKIPYRKGGGNGTDQSGTNGLSCKVFLLSGSEVGWTTSDSSYFPVDGAKLDYFTASSGGNSKRIAYLNGSAVSWGLRSPFTLNALYALLVLSNGAFNADYASYSYGIRPALILPPDMEVDSSGNVTPPVLTAHKTLINGTAYTVQGGKCMVNGTVYNILKGRTLIDGTAWDITFPEPLVMPVKGDLITMNLDGTDRLYRVLKVVDGTTVEVLGMWWSYSPWGNTARIYAGSPVDAYLNNTWYNSLSNDAKEAIVPRNVVQDSWYWGTSGNPKYSGTYGTSLPGTSYSISLGDANFHSIGNRYVYALSIQDIIDYLSDSSVLVDASLMLKNQNLWKMLSNSTSSQSSVSFWLRSAIADQTDASWTMNPASGSFARNGLSSTCFRRPAFQIDLSKIDFTIGGG